jgi:hypothetical protein
MKSILDPSFKYTSSVDTDIARTFARVRRKQRQEMDAVSPRDPERFENVTVFPRQRGSGNQAA